MGQVTEAHPTVDANQLTEAHLAVDANQEAEPYLPLAVGPYEHLAVDTSHQEQEVDLVVAP